MSVALNSRPAFWVGFPGKNIEVLTLYLEPLYLRCTSGSQTQDIKIGWRDTMQSGMQTIRLREVLRFYDLNDADRATLCLILGRSLLDLLQSTWANTHKYLTRIAIQDQSRAVVNARMKYPQRIVQQSPSPLIHLQVMKRIFYNLMGHHSGTWKMGEYKAGNGL